MENQIAETVRGSFNDHGRAEVRRLVAWTAAPRRTTSVGDRQLGHDEWSGEALIAFYLASTPAPADGGTYPAGRWLDVPLSHTEVAGWVELTRYGSGPGIVRATESEVLTVRDRAIRREGFTM